MKTLTKKLKSNRGESLTESLVAILIFTLSSIMLLSMIATAAKINYQAKKNTEKLNEELYYAEAQDTAEGGVVADEEIEVFIKDDSYGSETMDVIVYSAGEDKLFSFEWNKNAD